MTSDIDRKICQKVMGWHTFSQFDYDWWCPCPKGDHDLTGLTVRKHETFSPSTDISDFWLVEETLMEKGLTCEYIDALIEITNILIVDSDKSKQVANYRLTSAVIFLLLHATPEQRCLAALEAVS